ncbi:MAG: redoxin family protein [Kiritimatiellae bacterium]|nr:redoxin family protein [Kiritimatiellia bacterium]
MMKFAEYKTTAVTILGVLFLATSLATGAPMPEFGNSVQFDKSGPDIAISRLKGKAILIIFFQSWCGICNGWAPELIKQVEEAHGNNRSLIMVAIKTDGGGVSGAKNYLKSKKADLTKWCIGSDKNATFYKKVTGANELWGYVLVNSNGSIAKQGKAGSYRPIAKNKKQYSLSSKGLLKSCGKLETILPANKEYPPELSQITRLAELGCFGEALSLCKSATQRSKTRVAAKELKQDIINILETRIRSRMDTLKDTKKDGGSRYESYKELSVIIKDLRAVPAATEAKILLTKTKRDPVIQKEIKAETAYLKVIHKLKKASKSGRSRISGELKIIAKKYEGTKYGGLAEEERQKLLNESKNKSR